MLMHLTIENLAVVEAATLELSPGLNVLTGETGAGKSVIVDALELLRGAQRSRARIRDGASAALVEAQFLPSAEARERLRPVFERHDLELDEEIIVGRRLEASGRTRSYVQGRLVPRAVLAEVGEELVEICGQHESHTLRTGAAQLAVLDAWAGLTDDVALVSRRYGEFRAAEERLSALRARQAELERRRDFLSYQLAELSRVDLPGYVEAKRRLELVRATSEVRDLCSEVAQVLVDGEDAVDRRVAWLGRRASLASVGGTSEGEGALAPLREAIAVVSDALERAVREARVLSMESAVEPGELEALEQLVDEAQRLAHKHRRRPDELVAIAEGFERELADLESLEADAPRFEQEARERGAEVEKLAARLHEARSNAAARLGAAITGELQALCLTGATLDVRAFPAALGPQGATSVELAFCPNPGQMPAPLGRIASGGELSRVLLALRVASRHAGGLAVFDEIDAGAGGHVAERIGERLRSAARSGQVLCVTHWPQVAAHAEAHFLVQKLGGENTVSRVMRLQGEERLDELSRMLGGNRSSARSHAGHLLAGAGLVATGAGKAQAASVEEPRPTGRVRAPKSRAA
jgi:DNA repair protein RecN (Recombination protein N)